MPLPKPKDKEKEKDFIQRCMDDKGSVDEFEDNKQRFAVCNDLWKSRQRDNKIKEENLMETNIKKPKDETYKKPKEKADDHFDREDAADARAGEIGCTGTHRVTRDGQTFYMPCGTHDEWVAATSKQKNESSTTEDKDCVDGTCQTTDTKNIIFEAEIKSDEHGIFSGYASTFGNLDQGNDIITKGAFQNSLLKRPANKIKLLSAHKTDEPIGIFENVAEDEKGLYVKGKLAMGTQRGRETYELLKLGALDGMSIGFKADPSKQSYDEKKRSRTLREIELLEISLVTFPMNEKAIIHSVKGNSKNIREWEKILRDTGGLSRTEAKMGAKALMEALNHREDEGKQLATLIQKVADILNK